MNPDKLPPPPTPVERLLTVAEVQRLLQVSRSFVYEKVARGDIEHVRLGHKLRFETEAIKRYIEKNRSTAPRATVLPIAGARR